MKSVWIYESLKTKGYRFNDVITLRYCYVPIKQVNNLSEAVMYLESNFKDIIKLQSEGKDKLSEIIEGNTTMLIIDES